MTSPIIKAHKRLSSHGGDVLVEWAPIPIQLQILQASPKGWEKKFISHVHNQSKFQRMDYSKIESHSKKKLPKNCMRLSFFLIAFFPSIFQMNSHEIWSCEFNQF